MVVETTHSFTETFLLIKYLFCRLCPHGAHMKRGHRKQIRQFMNAQEILIILRALKKNVTGHEVGVCFRKSCQGSGKSSQERAE